MADDRTPPLAVALAYEPGEGAPRVVAKGRGEIAAAILRAAAEANIPERRDEALATLLDRVALDAPIPPALYVAVAEVLAWVHRLEHPAAP